MRLATRGPRGLRAAHRAARSWWLGGALALAVGAMPGAASGLPPAHAAAPRSGAGAADWTTFGFDAAHGGENPLETRLGVANVGRLAIAWAFDLGGVSDTQPLLVSGVVAGGARRDLVLVGSERGYLFALDASTGRLVWQRYLGAQNTSCPDLPGGVYGVTSTPVVDRPRGVVYAAGGDDRLYALDLATGSTRPGWPLALSGAPTQEHIWSALTLSRGLLYVSTASFCDASIYRGRLIAVDVGSARPIATFYPATPHGFGGGIWGWGGAAVDPRSGDVYVATANAEAPLPENYSYAEHVVRLNRHLQVQAANAPHLPTTGDADFGATPLLYRAPGCPPQLAVVHKSGRLLIYDRDAIDRGPRQQLQIASEQAQSSFGTYAYSRAQNTLYVANATDSVGPYRHGLLALGVTSHCHLALRWQHALGPKVFSPPSPPVVANGVVYVALGDLSGVFAFDARSGRRLGDTGTTLHAPPYAAPTVAGGRLYVASWDDHIYAFR